jgi:hypothetical protein
MPAHAVLCCKMQPRRALPRSGPCLHVVLIDVLEAARLLRQLLDDISSAARN